MRTLLVIALLLLAGCGSRPDPWGHRLTEAERVAWGRACGSKYSYFNSTGIANYLYGTPSGEKIDTECTLGWDVKNNRLFEVGVSVGVAALQATPPSADLIEPYIRMVEELLPPDERRIARKVSAGPFQYVKTKNFQIEGGFGTATSWDLTVVLRWDR